MNPNIPGLLWLKQDLHKITRTYFQAIKHEKGSIFRCEASLLIGASSVRVMKSFII